jgi:DNA repair and recombination protein RAD52
MQYTEADTCFSEEALSELKKSLDKQLVRERKGGKGKVKYLAGHTVIDQANRIFGFGNWAYEPLSVEQVVLLDPLTGEAVGIEYKAMVKLLVRGAVASIVDIGSQSVAAWNLEDQVMLRRINDAERKHAEVVEDSPYTFLEKKQARAVIMEAHEAAKKGAVTDGLKRCLRAYGSQFGNELYGDTSNAQPSHRTATAEQVKRIGAYCQRLKREQPQGELTYEEADKLLRELVDAYNNTNKKKSA